jgi:DNA invertase Pin-like site-specific DNA recombinase
MARKTKRIATLPGYVQYLRTSDEEAQAPERSQDGQRRDIRRLLQLYSDLPDLGEYIDNYTGTSADRKYYQQMLRDARSGQFSHVFAATPDRFGRDDVEALRAIDELTALGICVRFASHPDLNPDDEDDRLYLNILFGMAKRESRVIARRCRNGMLSKLLKGGWPFLAPDGYLNKEVKLTELGRDEHLKHARYKRWVELDEGQSKVWRYAWDLLLSDHLTLEDICEELYERGYRLRDGKPFVEVDESGPGIPYIQQLSRAFHNWFYAGWVVVDNDWAKIPPKTVRGEWEPIVSTEEFEKGLAILAKRNNKPEPRKKWFYLLQGLVFLEYPDGTVRKLTCGTPNGKRKSGGVSYYCIPSSGQNFLCYEVDCQIPDHLRDIQVDPALLPHIRQVYLADVDRYTTNQDRESKDLAAALKRLENKEVNLWRAFTEHGMRPQIFEKLAREYDNERRRIERTILAIQRDRKEYVANLDAALAIIAEIADRYILHTPERQRDILKQMVSRVVINPGGRIVRIELMPPFNYLDGLHHSGENDPRGQHPRPQNKRTSDLDAGSLHLKIGGPEGIRTPYLYSAIVALSQMSYRPQKGAQSGAILAACQGDVKVEKHAGRSW